MIYSKMKTLDTPRWYTFEGKLFCIRDVWKKGYWREQLNRCEYAQWSNTLQKLIWTECPDGAIFTSMKPIGDVKEWET